MGLFGRHKNKKEDSQSSNVSASSLKTMSQVEASQVSQEAPPMDLGPESKLSPPPVIGNLANSMNKNSSSSATQNYQTGNFNNMANPQQSTQPQFANQQQMSNTVNDSSFDLGEDSLFDLSDFTSDESPNGNAPMSHSQNSVVPTQQQFQQQNVAPSMNYPVPYPSQQFQNSPAETDMSKSGSLAFVENRNSIMAHQKDYFITTGQFRSVLEIIESIKTRIKESSETHLRLMDIKSEEDIEYENLRKDFQFIENKLYELDSVIFDK